VKIFTADKIQLRENVSRSGERTLALDMAQNYFHKLASAWGSDVAALSKQNIRGAWKQSSKRKKSSASVKPENYNNSNDQRIRCTKSKASNKLKLDAQIHLVAPLQVRSAQQDFARRQKHSTRRGIGI